jgi:hypothetical protein
MVPLLNIAVLIAVAGLRLLSIQTIATHQTLVAIRELGRVAHVVDRRRKPVGAMAVRHFAQRPVLLIVARHAGNCCQHRQFLAGIRGRAVPLPGYSVAH